MPASPNSAEVILEVDVIKFRALGTVMTTTVAMEVKSAPTPPPGVRKLVIKDGNYRIRVKPFEAGSDPSDPTPDMRISFMFKKPKEYVFLGVAFSERNFSPVGPDNIGQTQFPEVVIVDRGDNSQKMTVTNVRKTKDVSFDYLILLQQVSTGEIGVIDPEIENEY